MRADARLREKSYGVAECRPQAWLDERFIAPPAVGDRRSDHEGIAGAETKGEFAERIYAAMAEILLCAAEYIVIVTHGCALTYIVTAWLEIPWDSADYASFASKRGSITALVEDDFFHNRQAAALADITYLNH